MRNIAWDCRAFSIRAALDYANLLSCSCCITLPSAPQLPLSARTRNIIWCSGCDGVLYKQHIYGGDVGRRRNFDVGVHARRPRTLAPARRKAARAPCVRLRVSGNDRFSRTPRIPLECMKHTGRMEERSSATSRYFHNVRNVFREIMQIAATDRKGKTEGGKWWKFNTLPAFITSSNLFPYDVRWSTDIFTLFVKTRK